MPGREAQLSESIRGALSPKIYARICLLTVAVTVAVAVVVALLVTVIAVVVAVRVAIVVGIVVVASADVAAALGQLEIISGRQ